VPVKVKGLIEVRKGMRQLAPDLDKELTKNVRSILKPVVKTARSYATPRIPGLSGWTFSGRGKAISAGNSAFRVGTFPKYNASEVRSGIKYSLRKSRPNSKGFTALYKIINESRAGSIYETAGRLNFGGSERSKSSNPNAGYHFNLALNTNSPLKGDNKLRGRLIYRAWYEDNQKATKAVLQAIDSTTEKFARYVTNSKYRSYSSKAA
jgi:hypothetical protein